MPPPLKQTDPDCEAVYIDGESQVVYAARKQSGDAEVYAIDVSDPYNPVIAEDGLEYANGVESLYAAGDYLFVVAQGDPEFMVYDVTDPFDIRWLSSLDVDGLAVPTDVAYKDNVFYVTLFDRDALRIITAY